jgi:CheY-like chemotaxis protein/HPt (histidine-containing phosphotransfer) domain-containing protein
VLVAEDSHTNWVIISSLLEHMGHRHTLAENGQLALEALASGGDFDLVLMDGRMPVMDGLTATRQIRSGQWNGQAIPDPRIPIFGLTANAGANDREKFMNAGLDHFLSKPVNEEALHRALQGVIDKRPAVAIQPRSAALSYVREVPRRPVATPSAIDPEPAVAARTRAEARRDALVKVFMEQAPQLIQEIKDATAQGDWPSAAMKVHSIKGSVAYFWPDSKIFQQCAELERLADHVQVAQFATSFAEMETELASLFQSSAKLQASH